MRFKKHIALLLLGLFVFPILFQPLHVVLFHSNNNSHAQQHCCTHKSCHVLVKHEHSGTVRLEQGDETCAICEYHFAITEVTNIAITSATLPYFSSDYISIAKQQKYLSTVNNKSPRAPPLKVS